MRSLRPNSPTAPPFLTYLDKGGGSGGGVHIAYSTTKPKTYSNAKKLLIKNAFIFKIRAMSPKFARLRSVYIQLLKFFIEVAKI